MEEQIGGRRRSERLHERNLQRCAGAQLFEHDFLLEAAIGDTRFDHENQRTTAQRWTQSNKHQLTDAH